MSFIKGLYYFNFGTTGASFFSWTTIIAGGAFGFYTKSWGWRIIWSGLNILIALGMYASHGRPMEALIGSISTLIFFQLPFWTSVYLQEAEEDERIEKLKNRISGMSEIGVVQYIENYFNCLIATNSGWLIQNWHNLSDDQKCNWVKSHRKQINEKLYMAQNALELIQLMQQWSRFKKAS
ncbi:MAG: hypothetical protein ACPGJV_11670 [Bacteriovoracaceae bacterium]